MKLLLLGIIGVTCLPSWAASIPLSITQVSSTEGILHYTATSGAACTVEVSESNTYSPLVHDFDSTLFSGSNLDSRVTSANSGTDRWVVMGKRAGEQATSGRWYSRALQALTTHYVRVTCNGGADTGTATFSTMNIPLGNTYNEALPPNPNVTTSGYYSYNGQYAYPEFINWSNTDVNARKEAIIDPKTGLAIKRWTMPMDNGNLNDHTFVAASGTNWTSPSNALGNSSPATYSNTTSDWLFLNDSALDFGDNKLESLVASFKAWCSIGACATAADRTIQVAITVNGVSPWPSTSNVYDIILGTTSGTVVKYGDGNLSMFPWTPAGAVPLVSKELNIRSGNTNVDGSGNVSYNGGFGLFYPGWSAGSKITIGGNVCTIASFTNPQSIAITPATCAGLTLPATGAAWSAGNFGILIRKKNSSTDTINIQAAKYTLQNSAQGQWPASGVVHVCNSTPVTQTSTGHTGYQCIVGNSPQVYFMDSSTGDATWLGFVNSGTHAPPDGWGGNNLGCNNQSWTLTGGDGITPLTYYCANSDENNKSVMLKCTVTTTNDNDGSWGSSRACVNMTKGSLGADTLSLGHNFAGVSGIALDNTQFTGIAIIAILANGKLVLQSPRSNQDTISWMMIFDPSLVSTAAGCVGALSAGNPGCITAAMSSWAVAPCRWCTMHSVTFTGVPDQVLLGPKYTGSSPGTPGGGAYTSLVISPTLTSTPGINQGSSGCPVDANASGCDAIVVDGEPCLTTPASGSPGDPLNCPKNGAWSWLQNVAVGDIFSFTSGALEYTKLVVKTDATHWTIQRGYGLHTVSTPNVPTNLHVECLARNDSFVGGNTPPWNAVWDSAGDPHGSGSGLTVGYGWDHVTTYGTGRAVGGFSGGAFSIGYAISDVDGYVAPTVFANIGPNFDGKFGVTSFDEASQNHPSHSQYNAPPSEQKWFADVRPVAGPGPSLVDVATLVTGQLYKFISTTADGDNLTLLGSQAQGTQPWTGDGASAQNGLISRKIQPTAAFCGSQPMIDISSATTGNVITTDATGNYRYCEARKVNECRTGSAIGDIYANCPSSQPRWAYSNTYGCNNNYTALDQGLANDLCFNNTGAYLNGVTQVSYASGTTDTVGAYGRLITQALLNYRIVDGQTMQVRTTPDGLWLLWSGFSVVGQEFGIYSAKMLPMPNVDNFNRQTFVPLTVNITPPGGTNNAIIRFGYIENGTTSQLYCTSRQEVCLANASTVQAIPFQFPSDGSGGTQATVAGVACSVSCTIAVPALPQHAVYYVVDYRDSGNTVLSSSATFVAIPDQLGNGSVGSSTSKVTLGSKTVIQ